MTAANGGRDAARIGRRVNINIKNKKKKRKIGVPWAAKTTVRREKRGGLGGVDEKVEEMRKKNGGASAFWLIGRKILKIFCFAR